MVGMARDLVEAAPKGSADCLLDMKPGWPADALGKVGEEGPQSQNRMRGRGSMCGEETSKAVPKKALISVTQCVWTWLWGKPTFRSSALPFI